MEVAVFDSLSTFWNPAMSRTNFHTQALISASKSLGIKFKRLDMLADALTHPSVVQNFNPGNISRPSTYQRLEFLGDRVLGLVIAERLIDIFPNESEGELARRYAALVSTATLADVARRIGLASHVKFSAGEEAQHGADNDANLADTCEAVIGALYLDGGLKEAGAFIKREWAELIMGQTEPPKDAKTALQEWTQARGMGLPIYKVVSEGGPAHFPTFEIEVQVVGYVPASGKGKSKRLAERIAAEQMLLCVGRKGPVTQIKDA